MSVPRTVAGFNAGFPYAVGGFDAGLPIRGLYLEAERAFPVLPDDLELLPDTRSDSWGLAWYRGLNAAGLPRFAVRDDVDLNPKIAYHEAGHALEEVLRRLTGAPAPWDLFSIGLVDVMARYWTFRGFEGDWKTDHLRAVAENDWQRYPSESWAEAFSAAVSGTVLSEWTYGRGRDLALSSPGTPAQTYDPFGGALGARAFFRELVAEISPELGDDMFTEQDRERLERVWKLLEAEGPKVWTARDQRGLDVESGEPFDPAKPPLDPRIIAKK